MAELPAPLIKCELVWSEDEVENEPQSSKTNESSFTPLAVKSEPQSDMTVDLEAEEETSKQNAIEECSNPSFATVIVKSEPDTDIIPKIKVDQVTEMELMEEEDILDVKIHIESNDDFDGNDDEMEEQADRISEEINREYLDLVWAPTEHKPFQCKECVEAFDDKLDLRKHHERCHKEVEEFKCHECHKCYTNKSALKKHVRKHGNPEHHCTKCDKSFTSQTGLKQHLSRHISLEERREFPCTQCDKLFTGKSELKKHLLRHAGKRVFKCTECDKSFVMKADLKRHSLTHSISSTDLEKHFVLNQGHYNFD